MELSRSWSVDGVSGQHGMDVEGWAVEWNGREWMEWKEGMEGMEGNGMEEGWMEGNGRKEWKGWIWKKGQMEIG